MAHNYVMMTLISFDDPGLVVLPYHRNLSGLSDEQLARVQARILEVFEAEPAGNRSAEEVVELVEERGRAGRVMAALTPDGAQLLTPAPFGHRRRLGRWRSPKPGCWRKKSCAQSWATGHWNTSASCTTTTKRRKASPTAPCKWPF